jgi:hypothetical protein
MENTASGTAAESMPLEERSAVQNRDSVGAKLKMALLWLAVILPMIWGVMHVMDGTLTVLP